MNNTGLMPSREASEDELEPATARMIPRRAHALRSADRGDRHGTSFSNNERFAAAIAVPILATPPWSHHDSTLETVPHPTRRVGIPGRAGAARRLQQGR